MTFLRVVEVFPPIIQDRKGRRASLDAEITSFVNGVRDIKDYADLILVANLKDPKLVTVSPVAAASLLVAETGVDASPVIVVRDTDSRELSSAILGTYSLGIRTIMIAWGDKQAGGHGRGPRGFSSLSQALSFAAGVARISRVKGAFLAPVHLDRLSTPTGVELAKSRLKAGADLLLAQPPTTDSESLDSHLAILDSCGLRHKVLLSIFPFRGRDDVLRSEKYFGWRLPSSLKLKASRADYSPIDEARALARRLRKEGMPGLYLSTRGSPDIARQILA